MYVFFFQKSVDNFEIASKTCQILVWGALPLNDRVSMEMGL